MNKNLLLSAAVAGLLVAGAATTASADDVKCFGIAKAGQNSCANGSVHSCKGMSKVDNDPGDFIMASSADDCTKQGGKASGGDMMKK